MTFKRFIACSVFYCLLYPALFGQNQEQSPDTIRLTIEQLQQFASMTADSVGGDLTVPNVFTPNGDQVNDHFEVTTDGTTTYEFTVFTRNGARIFHSSSTRIFWDGNGIGGQELPEGIYYYVIEEQGGSDPFQEAGIIYLYR